MNVGTAALLGFFVIVAAFLMGGRYQAVGGPRGSEIPLVYVVDRFSGNVWFCGGAVCRQSTWQP